MAVALRKESVDRNNPFETLVVLPKQSLSARRAWIEIAPEENPTQKREVALRKESVDRNMLFLLFRADVGSVALRKESVDRNIKQMPLTRFFPGRSPQGERG